MTPEAQRSLSIKCIDAFLLNNDFGHASPEQFCQIVWQVSEAIEQHVAWEWHTEEGVDRIVESAVDHVWEEIDEILEPEIEDTGDQEVRDA